MLGRPGRVGYNRSMQQAERLSVRWVRAERARELALGLALGLLLCACSSLSVERTTKNNKTMVTGTMACDVAGYGSDGEDTEWYSLAAFGNRGDDLARHKKGDLLACMGQLTRRRYKAHDGTDREGWSVTVDAIVSARTVRPGGKRSTNPAEKDTAISATAESDFPDDDIGF